MSQQHLGSWVSALADGQLGEDAAARALAHVAVCPACAEELEAARTARRLLSAAPEVAPDPDLTSRLLSLSASIPPALGDPLREGPRAADPWSHPRPAARTLTGDLVQTVRRRRRRRTVLAGVGGAGVVVGTLFALGAVPLVAPDPSTADSLTLLGRAGTTTTAAGQDVLADVVATGAVAGAGDDRAATLAWMRERGWLCPTTLPDDLAVTGVRLLGARGDVLEVDLEGSGGAGGQVVVREQVGRLDLTGVVEADRLDVDGRAVHVLSRSPWHVVWQSGSTVVDVVADVPERRLRDLVAAFPDQGYDSGVLPRISRGWTTMTGALASP